MNDQRILCISTVLLPIIPLLFLYNQNIEYLSLKQVLVLDLILMITVAAFWWLIQYIFSSLPTTFITCIFFVILIFSYDYIYDSFLDMHIFGNKHDYTKVLLIPLFSYIFAYVIHKYTMKYKFNYFPKIFSIMILVMITLNIYPLFTIANSTDNIPINTIVTEYSHSETPTPNIYWILYDGLLGFQAMENYFHDPQNKLNAQLLDREFSINKDAMLESGHKTRIAVPALMCPTYYDTYLKEILIDHEKAMNPQSYSYTDLYNARFYNETILAFDSKGYTTVSMSIDEDIFFPTTDFFYYIAAHKTPEKELAKLPYYVEKKDFADSSYYRSRYFAHQLGSLFLGGIPGAVFDFMNKNDAEHHQLTTYCDKTEAILLGGSESTKFSTLINSIYDTLHSKEVLKPQFVLIHNFMPHFPYYFDEQGNLNLNNDSFSSYSDHHTYCTKVLINIVDMILEVDPDAVIVLQADHGLHGYSEEQIVHKYGDSDAPIMIWNSVFSAIRIPHQYKTDDLMYAIENPLNISRYLINSFVGENYQYIETDSP